MGIIAAKVEEERAEFDASRLRAADVLERSRPEYCDDLQRIGLAPQEDDFDDILAAPVDDRKDDDEEAGREGDASKGHGIAEDDPVNKMRLKHLEMLQRDRNQFLKACASGRWFRAQALLRKEHVFADTKDVSERTALHIAAERGHATILELLMKAKAIINVQSKDGWTPLHSAVFHGHVSCVDALLDNGAYVNMKEGYGCTPLIFAASSPKLFLVDFVSKTDRKKRSSARALNFKKQSEMEAKVQGGSKYGRPASASADAYSLYTYFPNRIELIIMNRLLATGMVDVDEVDNKRQTALIYAARYGHKYAVSRLLAANANPRAVDQDSRSALFHAACNMHLEVAKMLIEVGAAVNSQDGFLRTPLHGALESDDGNMANLLLQAEASVNAYDCEGTTPIMLAMDSKNRRIFVDLIRRRSNLNVLDRRGWNVLIYSIETGMFSEVLIYLEKLGHRAQPILRAIDPLGQNALHHAAALPSADAANRVVNPLAELDAIDYNGLLAEFFYFKPNERKNIDDTAAAITRIDNEVNYTAMQILREGAWYGLAQDRNFAARWRGRVMISTEGVYKFEVVCNDAFTVTIDNMQALASAATWGISRNSVDLRLTVGLHALSIEFCEAGGDCDMVFMYTGPDTDNQQIVVPVTALVPAQAILNGDCNGNTPVHFACELGRLEVLRLLTQRLPSAELPNNRGETPLLWAAHGGHFACVVSLLQDTGDGAMCNAEAVDSDGNTFLMHACESGHLDLVNMILQNKEGNSEEFVIPALDVNAVNKMGMTALHIAARDGNWQLLASLVLASADIAAKDLDGFNALHFAAIEDETVTVSCLLDLGLDVNSTDHKSWTPLMHTVARGCDEATRHLVDVMANLDMKNLDGDTALQICLRRTDRLAENTRNIITDGILNRECRATMAVPAQGHFMVSVIEGQNLDLQGFNGSMNPYVCLQFSSQADELPMAAFTSCAIGTPMPAWHECFRFDTEKLDTTAYLVAWLLVAPGECPAEIVEATTLGVAPDQLKSVKAQAARLGIKLNLNPEFTDSIQQSFDYLTARHDFAEDEDISRLRRLALVESLEYEPTEDLKAVEPGKRATIPLQERRWQELANLLQVLKRGGCTIPAPVAPESHTPLGCVIVRFRHLRQAVWGTEPVTLKRMIRLNSRGTIKLQIDFRPRFFIPRAMADVETQADDEIYEIEPLTGDDAAADLANMSKAARGNQVFEAQPEEMVRLVDGELPPSGAAKRDVEFLYKRFTQMAVWTHKVMQAANKASDDRRPVAAADGPRPLTDMAIRVRREVSLSRQRMQATSELRRDRLLSMDKPLETPKAATLIKKKKAEEQSNEVKFRTEPWLETFLEGSRII
mmetsp:Transcript_87022/g.244011  ORF Transcript_87022/g.244011 Transcript_87022/m.244011 type:complete len:1349 (-) Transcript_87022:56-4102(-)|eukprot:CAMPEP_0117466040 /NCGR_PEP_ID=MMETSP0784-20121206/4937_1 /TAXON_ID=39447 /ORGANISM="" /LENGTH=1348 /DNA_ID=CAMNT_0005259969 /DNA_START=20 /DNA_END=4066 /DNA_ORIENTATION=-